MSELVVMTREQLEEFATDIAEKVLAEFEPTPEPAFFTTEEAFQQLRVSRATFNKIRKRPGFPVVYYFDQPRYPRDELLAWARSQKEKKGDE